MKILEIVLILCVLFLGFSNIFYVYQYTQMDLVQYGEEPIIQYWNNPNQSSLYIDNPKISIHNIQGISMFPTLTVGDKILCDNSIIDYQDGMIINYNDGVENVTHRIKATYNNYIIVQGDNNQYTEDILVNQINCVVVGVIY